MKKPIHKKIFVSALIGLFITFSAIFLRGAHGRGIPSNISSSATPTPSRLIQNKNDGYAFSVPPNWYVEETGSDTIVTYPNYSPASASSSSPTCKIEMSVFPYASSTGISDWISSRLSADPTVEVRERSSEDISLANAIAIKWTGVMDDMPTTIIYAFARDHAYEIVPSDVGDSGLLAAQCDDDLDLFLKTLTF